LKEKIKKQKKSSPKSLIGGQALLEGVMMRSSTSMALAVRDSSGNILLETTRLKGAKKWYKKVPVVRGVAAFVDSLVLSVKTTTKAAEALMLEDEKNVDTNNNVTSKTASPTIDKKNIINKESVGDAENGVLQTQTAKNKSDTLILKKKSAATKQKKEKEGSGALGIAVVAAIIVGLLIGIGLFFALPLFLNSFIEDYMPNILVQSLVEGGIRIVIFVLYLFFTSVLPDIRRMFGYHGAEHRVISCFEKGLDLTVENVQTCSTRHNRCGTTFLFFVMMISILVFSLATWLLDFVGLNRDAVGGNSVVWGIVRFGIRLALLPLVAGLSFELLRLLAKFPDNWATWIFRAPGLALQRLTTYPPSPDMVEVALVAYNEVTAMDNNTNLKMLQFGQFRYSYLRPLVEERLLAIGAETAEVDWIFCSISGYQRSELSKLNILTYAQYGNLKQIMFKRTGKHFVENPLAKDIVGPIQKFEPQPLWYALGEVEFYGETIKVDNRVLIPRPETEMLAEQAIEAIENLIHKSKDGIVNVLDLCSGSGAIARVLAKNTNANILATDISEKALEVAKSNLEDTTVEIIKSDLFNNLQNRKFDLIVSNPPYIKRSDISLLQHEVQNCEPHLALDGGEDGLDFYRRITIEAHNFLKPSGIIMLEVGIGQSGNVWELLSKDFTDIRIVKDLEGIERMVIAVRK